MITGSIPMFIDYRLFSFEKLGNLEFVLKDKIYDFYSRFVLDNVKDIISFDYYYTFVNFYSELCDSMKEEIVGNSGYYSIVSSIDFQEFLYSYYKKAIDEFFNLKSNNHHLYNSEFNFDGVLSKAISGRVFFKLLESYKNISTDLSFTEFWFLINLITDRNINLEYKIDKDNYFYFLSNNINVSLFDKLYKYDNALFLSIYRVYNFLEKNMDDKVLVNYVINLSSKFNNLNNNFVFVNALYKCDSLFTLFYRKLNSGKINFEDYYFSADGYYRNMEALIYMFIENIYTFDREFFYKLVKSKVNIFIIAILACIWLSFRDAYSIFFDFIIKTFGNSRYIYSNSDFIGNIKNYVSEYVYILSYISLCGDILSRNNIERFVKFLDYYSEFVMLSNKSNLNNYILYHGSSSFRVSPYVFSVFVKYYKEFFNKFGKMEGTDFIRFINKFSGSMRVDNNLDTYVMLTPDYFLDVLFNDKVEFDDNSRSGRENRVLVISHMIKKFLDSDMSENNFISKVVPVMKKFLNTNLMLEVSLFENLNLEECVKVLKDALDLNGVM